MLYARGLTAYAKGRSLKIRLLFKASLRRLHEMARQIPLPCEKEMSPATLRETCFCLSVKASWPSWCAFIVISCPHFACTRIGILICMSASRRKKKPFHLIVSARLVFSCGIFPLSLFLTMVVSFVRLKNRSWASISYSRVNMTDTEDASFVSPSLCLFYLANHSVAQVLYLISVWTLMTQVFVLHAMFIRRFPLFFMWHGLAHFWWE